MPTIGIPTEIKDGERRVALTPSAVVTLLRSGLEVRIQAGAGLGAGFDDDDYRSAGASIVQSAEEVWKADLVVKVKEPVESEFARFRPGLRLFAFLHLAAEPALTDALRSCEVEAHAFETVVGSDGSLPILAPMSEVAGRAATQIGAQLLSQSAGMLIGGAGGVLPARVLVVGLGVAGLAAAQVARGMGAEVVGADVHMGRLRAAQAAGTVSATIASTPDALGEVAVASDLVIGAALVPGARAPTVLLKEHVEAMRPGSAIIDLAIDQGGCIETSRPTSLSDPTYMEGGVLHYCVTNVPGQFPHTASQALAAVLTPYIRQLACGVDGAHPQGSLNVVDGRIVHPAVASTLQPVN